MRAWFRFAGVIACTSVACCAMVVRASALPFERHYEMVSPVFKGGFGTTGDAVQAVAPDGEAVGFYSPGSFAGAPSAFFLGPDYLASRTATEWSTVPMNPPTTDIVSRDAFDLTPSLGLALMMGSPGANSINPLDEADFLLHATDTPNTSGWEFAGAVAAVGRPTTVPRYESASHDFCHVLVLTSSDEPLLPMAVGTGARHELYEFDRGCAGSPQSLALVGLNNKGELVNRTCDTRLGNDAYSAGAGSQFSAVNADGSEVFFTVCVKTSDQPFGHEVPHQVFVRLAGSRTVEVSRPLAPACEAKGVAGEVPCKGAVERASADFQGASEDGSRVYFTASLATGQPPLVPGATDASNNLYVATVGCTEANPSCDATEREVTSLTEVSHDPDSGQAANVLGVTRVALDGTRVYFVAEGDLLSGAQQNALEDEGQSVPQVGAANLYSYDSVAGMVSFVGDLCSGRELSGSVEDIHCPNPASDENVWMPEESQEAQTGGADGRFLVFATYAQLTSNDRNVARDVYRYDAATGRLERVSFGENGFDDNGNRTILDERGEALGARIMPGNSRGDLLHHYSLGTRAVSEDGSRIVFTSAEPLSPTASNGLENAYEWRKGASGSEGSVSLISSGGGSEPVNDVVISPNGTGVFFVTVDGLVPQDTDGLPDVYDARLGEGFPQPPAERRPCEGDACQGALTNPAPLLIPGSVAQVPGGNFASAPQVVKPKKKLKAKRKPKKRKGKTRAKKSASMRGRSGSVKRAVVRSGR
jgi:hypothetical protein